MTRSSVAKQFALVGLFCVSVLSFAFCAGPAQAQVVQPQYVRPSNGAAIDVKALLALSNGTATTVWTQGNVITSPVFDFSTFQTAIVTVKTQNNCAARPVIQVFGGPTAGGINFDFPISAPNAAFIYQSSDTIYYIVSPISSFIRFRVRESVVAGGGGPAAVCNVLTLTVTPVPFLAPQVISGSGMRAIDSGTGALRNLSAAASTLFGSNLPNAVFSKQTLIVQNQSVSPIYCSIFDDITPTNFSFSLAGGTAKANGTGGSRELRDWAGLLYCLVDPAAACLPNDCLVSALTY